MKTLDGMTVAQLDDLIARAQATKEKALAEQWVRFGGFEVHTESLDVRYVESTIPCYEEVLKAAMQTQKRWNKADMREIAAIFSTVMQQIAPQTSGAKWGLHNAKK